MNATIGFVGAGNFTEALVRGLRAAGVGGDRILVTTRSRVDRLEALRQQWGIVPVGDKPGLCRAASILILAMKPQDLHEAMVELAPAVTSRHLIITVLAGVTSEAVERYVDGAPVIRAMPNLPMAVRAGATAIACGRHVRDEHRALARALFDLVGETIEVDEGWMNAVTAVSGSGPAYVYLLIESLIEAAVAVGIPPDPARALALQTVLGAARLVRDTGADPADLRHRVTSPGGTTRAALAVLEARGFKPAVIEAVRRATERARELGG
ncbi:MAG: pyrroline-5-carboxylate reductase [Armatimonadota bacterium]|nr:pyrroline-5-carboxylate reductase [Armatimonadota bacterium]MDR7485972.1 pyrroline-5-carboxylate reductase [Armatimonadota bacterium]MDR7534331.1 pyrroline-5-carboxylate reductase [Armatimonadota bacterium]MDR7536909.1 pyrroline-5-carboxylate reductase [Armatimonadota bacterium]